jgi:hypothetical protein
VKILTDMLLAALFTTAVTLAIEAYLILGEVRRHTQHAKQILAAATDLLAHVPGKSAPRDATAEIPAVDTAQTRPGPTPGPRLDTRPAPAVLAEQADQWRKHFKFSEEGRR